MLLLAGSLSPLPPPLRGRNSPPQCLASNPNPTGPPERYVTTQSCQLGEGTARSDT